MGPGRVADTVFGGDGMKKALFALIAALALTGAQAFAANEGMAPHEISYYQDVEPEYVITLGVGDPVEELAWGCEYTMGVVFKKVIESETAGKIQVEVYPNSQLGQQNMQTEAVMSGEQTAQTGTGGIPSYYPPWQVFSIPYLFPNVSIATDVMNYSDFSRAFYEDCRQKTGLRILAMAQNGFRHFTNNKRVIKTPADLQGLKIRVLQGPIYQKVIESLGGSSVPIAWTELYMSLKTGVVDGQENAVSAVKSASLDEVQKYITLDGHLWAENFLIMNDKFFQSLPANYQQVVLNAGRAAEIAGTASEIIGSYYMGNDYALSKGMEIYSPTPEELAQFREKSQGPVVEWLRKEIGDKWVDEILKATEESKKKWGFQ